MRGGGPAVTAALRVTAAARATTGEVLPVAGFVAERREGRQIRDPRSQAARARENGVSTHTQRTLDALARHRPDLLEAVRAGELSAHRAAIEAGIVGKATDRADSPDRQPWQDMREAVERLVACPLPVEQIAASVPFYRIPGMARSARAASEALLVLVERLERRCGGRAGGRP
jgi:hypothetical protein